MNEVNKCTKCGKRHIVSVTCERYTALMLGVKLIKSGYGGCLPNGNIVDRREYPTAIPLQENELLGTPKPKEIWWSIS